MTQVHIPVMANEVLQELSLHPGDIVVDCTVGLGGHAGKFLEATEPNGKVIGIDKDEDAVEITRGRLEKFKDRCICFRDDFINMKKILLEHDIKRVHAVFFDLGVSFLQLDTTSRGFSFMKDGPLDMRMDRESDLTAYKIINEFPEEKILRIITEYGEEKYALKVTRAIIDERKITPILSTTSLARLITKCIGHHYKKEKIHPATRTFQALRIYINDEINSLQKVLPDAISMLFPGGKIAVVSFHSLEDRIVKNVFKEFEKGCTCPPDFPICQCGKVPQLKIITPKPLQPSAEEIEENPLSRSAKLRVAEKV